MTTIQESFEEYNRRGDKMFVPYFCAGDPTLNDTVEFVSDAEEYGAGMVEIGIPFSDPLADGPTIQKAVQRSLDNGTTMSDVFEVVRRANENTELPIVLMCYYNSVFRRGEERFIDDALDAGADGVLIVDLPPEEGADFFRRANEKGLKTPLLATPTTPTERLRTLSEIASGFLYYVTVTGVTGVRSGYNEEFADKLEHVGEISDVPVVVGFGVSDTELIRPYLDPVQGVVAGSVIIQAIEDNLDQPEKRHEAVQQEVNRLSNPLRSEAVQS
ncbi:MAG: tryptophan synthase subunit alpha [bacterium]